MGKDIIAIATLLVMSAITYQVLSHATSTALLASTTFNGVNQLQHTLMTGG